jgi:heme-degrading monooxygenase HmoA
MIARMWHGWTTQGNADAYQELLHTRIFPHIDSIDGARGAYLLRRDTGEEVEFITVTFFADLDAVRAFAGQDYETAVILPEAHKLLSRFDEKAVHYEAALTP